MGSRNSISVIVLIAVFLFQTSSCMECNLGHKSTFVENLDFINPASCPGIFGSSDKQYCCVSDNNRVFCCDAEQFFQNGFGILYPVLIAIGVAVVLILACCLCCCCCPCCWLYKRRQGGVVYQNPPISYMQNK